MSERTFTATGGGGDIKYQMYRRTPTGELTLVDVEFSEYVHPPRGAQGRFKLSGWSPFYETQSTFNGETKTVTRTRAEYVIVKMPSATDLEGRRFAQQFPVPKHIDNEKAKLGQFISALLDRPIQQGEQINIDDFIDTEFVTSVTRDEVGDNVYCGISWATIDPTKTKLSPYVSAGAATEPALVGVAAGAGEDDEDPFTEVEDL